jgi:hypothetical protein
MSKALTRLRKIERQAFKDWWKSARELAELYQSAMTADKNRVDEACTIATFAAVRAQQQWDRWQTLVGTITDLQSEIEAAKVRIENGRSAAGGTPPILSNVEQRKIG